jgi:hypothetical protein
MKQWVSIFSENVAERNLVYHLSINLSQKVARAAVKNLK